MKKVVIVNCFDTYEDRIDLLHDFFSSKGHVVTVVQSDFRHFKKVHRKDNKQNFVFVRSEPYYKNMSIARMKSHYNFAKEAFEVVNEISPDLLYVLVPPNSLAKVAAEYKKKKSNVKLIFDLIDLWPETMPVGQIKKTFPFTLWRLLRDKNLEFADFIITECDLYRSILEKVLNGLNTKTLYLAKKENRVKGNPVINDTEIHLSYLGSINNLIDIQLIKNIMRELNNIKPTTLHIIGDGESRDDLLIQVKETGAKVEYYGKIYEAEEKQRIFDRCHFGLNIMKDSVCVGLTMKSIDYFFHGLPIINNIVADTSYLVKKYNAGLNIDSNKSIENLAEKVASINSKEILEMRNGTNKMYNDLFTQKSFDDKLDKIINFNQLL